MSQANMTVAGTLWPASGVNSVLRAAILVAAGTLALAVAAKVQVPFGVSTPAQVAAIASLAAEDELLARVAAIVTERHRLAAALSRAA